MLHKTLTACLLTLALTACGEDNPWHGKDISGLMPPLQFTLTSESGDTVQADDFAGSINLLFFGYTHCPDVCPATLGRLRQALGELPPPVAGHIRVLFVSVDPRRDSPQQLRNYTDFFGDNVIGLTGDREQLDQLTRRYRTTYGYGEADAHGNYDVSHGSAVYAFAGDGSARLLIRGDAEIAAVAEDLTRLVHDH